jgi:hypothetical protein
MTDPALYVAGLWAKLPEPLRALVLETESSDQRVRSRAWNEVVRCGDPHSIALALDFFLSRQAASRFGSDGLLDREGVRQAALGLLARPAFAGQSRFGNEVPNASHILALRALGFAAAPDDVAVLTDVSAIGGDLFYAWTQAIHEALRQSPAAPIAHVLDRLFAVAVEPRNDINTRTSAVLAVAASSSTPATAMLHAIARAVHEDVRIEALAALAVRHALDAAELEEVRTLLAQSPGSAAFAVRRAELLAAVAAADGQ